MYLFRRIGWPQIFSIYINMSSDIARYPLSPIVSDRVIAIIAMYTRCCFIRISIRYQAVGTILIELSMRFVAIDT
jgi:hypothetical protein